MITDTKGKPHPIFKDLNIDTFWERVILNVLPGAHVELDIFSELRRQPEALKRPQEKCASRLSPLDNLPDEYLVAILRLRFYLSQMANEWLNILKTTVVASPPMRSFFVCMPAENLNNIVVTMKPGLKLGAVAKELVWLLQTF